MGFRGDLGVSRAQNKLQGLISLLHMYPLLAYNMWQYFYHNNITNGYICFITSAHRTRTEHSADLCQRDVCRRKARKNPTNAAHVPATGFQNAPARQPHASAREPRTKSFQTSLTNSRSAPCGRVASCACVCVDPRRPWAGCSGWGGGGAGEVLAAPNVGGDGGAGSMCTADTSDRTTEK